MFGTSTNRRERVQVVAAAADVRENENDARMPAREVREIGAVRDLLSGPLAASVLPDVVQNREPVAGRRLAHGIEQRIVGPAAREQLHADRALADASIDLRERVGRVVGVHGDVHGDAPPLALEHVHHGVVPGGHVVRRREVRRR